MQKYKEGELIMKLSQSQKDDFEWFVSNYQDLFNKYGKTYLVIKNKKVIGTYDTFADAVYATEDKEPDCTYIIQYCDGTESAYTNYVMPVILPPDEVYA